MATQPQEGRRYGFAELNRLFGVRVVTRWNDHGCVKVGVFTTYAAAHDYADKAQFLTDGKLNDQDRGFAWAIWPPRERAPENDWINKRSDEIAQFYVIVLVPALAGKG